jgi:hypothetical protein
MARGRAGEDGPRSREDHEGTKTTKGTKTTQEWRKDRRDCVSTSVASSRVFLRGQRLDFVGCGRGPT